MEALRISDAQAWVEANDKRPRVPLKGKAINLAQLDTELGGYGLCASGVEVVAADGSPVTLTELASAVAAHVAVFPPVPPTQAELVAALPDPTKDFPGFKVALADLLTSR
jgi:hypothetical protein